MHTTYGFKLEHGYKPPKQTKDARNGKRKTYADGASAGKVLAQKYSKETLTAFVKRLATTSEFDRGCKDAIEAALIGVWDK